MEKAAGQERLCAGSLHSSKAALTAWQDPIIQESSGSKGVRECLISLHPPEGISMDVCVQDEWVSAESHSCLRKCMCPPDGTACTLAAACDAQHFVCKNGWQRFSNGQPKCFKPGCLAGSLHEIPTRSVENGQAFAVCTCSGADIPFLTCSSAMY